MGENKKLVNRYIALRGNNITDRTKEAFRWDLNVFLGYLNDKPIVDVTHKDIDGFLKYCAVERNNGDQALNRKYNTLNAFFKTLIAKEYLDMKNPLDKVEKIKIRKRVRGHVSLSDYRAIMQYLEDEKDLRGQALFSLLLSSGIRISELHQLDRNSFDFDERSFTVIGKGDKGRTCVFSAEAGKHIQAYLGSRTDELLPMFISRENNRWSVSGIQSYVKQTALKAGVSKNVHPHLMRHGCAMLLLENGMPLDEIQKVLGHENIATTQLYAQTSMVRVKQNVDKIYEKVEV